MNWREGISINDEQLSRPRFVDEVVLLHKTRVICVQCRNGSRETVQKSDPTANQSDKVDDTLIGCPAGTPS
ncbi:unnamed protein product [Soboliphyme baturini]|uniref:Transposase n=1 Tax=Soboliphyme baturini TaxID=241478 RepID=A0A183IFA3_9BILA|nr:unnamed protein product [Soboliphyme baturini]